MKRNHSISTPTVGGSSLLVIFAVLCLTVFALLSLSTVQAEKRMADASAADGFARAIRGMQWRQARGAAADGFARAIWGP